MNYSTYTEIKKTRDAKVHQVFFNHSQLNTLHDETVKAVVNLAIKKTIDSYGPLPSPFTFFVMGSAGRFEQSIWSDQDHGIIYNGHHDRVKSYFLLLGKEISDGLYQIGYEYCDGGVMANNPLWCNSLSEWNEQLSCWIHEASWKSIRNLLIFIDGRSLYGVSSYMNDLKNYVYHSVHTERLLSGIVSNTMSIKRGVGIFGQLLVETHGEYSEMLNIKDTAFFPYVNAAKCLAIKEKNLATSTISRLMNLENPNRKSFTNYFIKLLDFRLSFSSHTNYKSGHYLPVNFITDECKKEIKKIIKNGILLNQYVQRVIESGD
ncbi:MAG: DUF294 nucleotidyltransferase-like domain-containing protein [Bacillota bacterium]|nr:DUF294 nucleotidyltransferase-like domain-containing protein [Bacillota bacterium]